MKFKFLVPVVALAVTVAFAAPSMAALTSVEIHQFFCGALTSDPGDAIPAFDDTCKTTDTGTTEATAGSTIYIPIWLKPLQGNNPGPTSVTAAFFEVHGVTASTADFVPRNGHLYSGVFGNGGLNNSDGLEGDLSAATGGNPGVRYMEILGATVGTGTPMSSDAPGDSGNGAFYLGYFAVQVAMTASVGDSIDLYFNVPRAGGNKYATGSTSGSQNTVGYQASGGTPNGARYTSTNNDVFGTVNNHFSTLSDYSIEVVPEPTTLGLLALGLLGVRRMRRLA